MLSKKKIGIVGLGSVGWAVVHKMMEYYQCNLYDIYDENYYKWDDIVNTDIVFLCVSTPLKSEHLDCSNLEQIINKLDDVNYSGLIVVKSTVRVGFMNEMVNTYPNRRLVYMPEFLREKNCYTWFMEPDRLVVSGEQQNCQELLEYFIWVDNRVPRIILTHIEAEISKLAHNAYISVKVSFTNEIEEICDKWHADAINVMSVIWADRRVKCKEHLTPYLGPYGGKCIPKDTMELINSSPNSIVLKAAEQRNSVASLKYKKHITELQKYNGEKENKIVVVIATRNRSTLLDRALESIRNQMLTPNLVIIIDDSDNENRLLNEKLVLKYSSFFNLVQIKNNHTKNLSGAINSGIDYVISERFDLQHTFIALLDDDDWWDKRYLVNNLKFAEETNANWVISGLIRHDKAHPQGQTQSIPQSIGFSDFLVSNPNVQGSNLFVNLEMLIKAGKYDEEMISTTDRDVCIRLCRLSEIKYAILRNPLVHHDASDEWERLSTPGSERKKKGLTYFYQKYQDLMTEEQKEKYKLRAKTLFSVDIS